MTFQAAEIAIQQRLRDNWTTTPISYDNSDFSAQNDVPYIHLSVIDGFASQVDWGKPTNTYRHLGVIVCQIFVPIGVGTGLAKGYADSIAAIWRSARFSGITCLTPRVEKVGEIGSWFQINVTVDFRRDEIF